MLTIKSYNFIHYRIYLFIYIQLYIFFQSQNLDDVECWSKLDAPVSHFFLVKLFTFILLEAIAND